MGTPPPAGWFTSPDDVSLQRWWDGDAWTTFTRPVPAAAEVPAQRVASSLPGDPDVDERIRAASSGEYQNTAEALDALQHQGGLIGAFAAMANQALTSQQPTTAAPNSTGVQPYGQPGLQNLFGASTSTPPADTGVNLSWRAGAFSGGSDPDDRYDAFGRRRRRNAGPLGTLFLGLLFLIVGTFVAFSITSQSKVHADESTASGKVVEHRTSYSNSGGAMCSPIASFTVGGATYRAGSNTSSSNCASIGSSVSVIYTTAAPGDGTAHIQNNGFTDWLIWLLPLVGLVVTILGVRMVLAMGRSIRALLPFGNR